MKARINKEELIESFLKTRYATFSYAINWI